MQGQRILVVDDEPLNREIAQLLLEAKGYVVATAADGLEAVKMASQTHYPVILMDMQMPHLNGLDATQQIRAQTGRADPAPCIIALTGNAFAEDKARCLAAGMNHFLAKPYTPEELYALVREGMSAPNG